MFRNTLIAALFASAALGCVQGCDKNGKSTAPAAATSAPAAPAESPLDALLAGAWREAGVAPAPLADDATFMRRSYLDLTGTLPTVAEARAFLDDGRADKRVRLVDELLASDAYAVHFARYWDEVLMEDARQRTVDRNAFRQWFYGRLRANAGWDSIVRELITAEGKNSSGGQRRRAPEEVRGEPDEGVNGAVNWLVTGAQQPQNLAGDASRVFLGVQIQCAECHDHKTEKWTQEDFRHFTAAFMRVTARRVGGGKKMGAPTFEIEDAERANRRMKMRMNRTGYSDAEPRALDGTSLEGDNPRAALATWMTAPENPWFARALVNRMWGYLLGSGFVMPIDDFREGQDVAAPALLDALAKDFVAHGYDLRHLLRTICLGQAYQRAPGEGALWSRFTLRPMDDAQLVDAITTASMLEPVLEEVAGERLPQIKERLRRSFRFAFDVDEAASADTFTGTVPQALMLLNGVLVSAGSSALEGSTLGAAVRLPGGGDATLEHLYLATLSRRPNAEELGYWKTYVKEAAATGKPPRARGAGPVAKVYRQRRLPDLGAADAAYEDVLWALLNSSEFFFIH